MSQCAINAGRINKRVEATDGNTLKEEDSKNKKVKKRIYVGIIFVGVFFCALIIGFFCFKVSPKESIIYYELGDTVSSLPSDYLNGNEISVNMASVNLHKVDLTKCGTYKVYIKHFFNIYECEVAIVDTEAPSIIDYCSDKVFALYEEISPEDLINEVSDQDNQLTYMYRISSDGIYSDDLKKVSFSNIGRHEVVVKVTDSSSNTANIKIPVVIDTVPKVYTFGDYYVSLGAKFNDDGYYGAIDDKDGDITDKVYSDFNPECINHIGNYKITYYAKDSNGLTGRASCYLHVYDPLQLQNLVDSGTLNKFANNIMGLINEHDTGYLVEASSEKAIENIKNSVVRIHYETKYSWTNGSGFIIKINDDDVIICTNSHVVGDRSEVTVSFFDGENIKGTVFCKQTAPDIAFVTVRKSDIPFDTYNELKSIHINLNYYKELSASPQFEMGMYCINEDGSEWLTRYGKIVNKSGVLEEYFEGYDYPVTEVTVKLIPGVSGSAIVDSYGNLICMATYTWVHDGKQGYYAVSLDDILDYYEEIFNERLEYY